MWQLKQTKLSRIKHKRNQRPCRNLQNLLSSATWTMRTSLTCLRCPLTPGSRSRWAWTMARTSKASFTLRGRTFTISYQSSRSPWRHTLLSGKTLTIIRWKTVRTYLALSTAKRMVRMMYIMFLMSPTTLHLTIWPIKCPSGCLSSTNRVR